MAGMASVQRTAVPAPDSERVEGGLKAWRNEVPFPFTRSAVIAAKRGQFRGWYRVP